MGTAVPGLVLLIALAGAVDFLTNLKAAFTGDKAALNAVVKNILAFVAFVGILLLAAQTVVAGGYSLKAILPVDNDVTIKSLSVADVCFVSIVAAFNAAIIATFRKAFDGSQTAAQPSLVKGNV